LTAAAMSGAESTSVPSRSKTTTLRRARGACGKIEDFGNNS
jgi:hypothetical protein